MSRGEADVHQRLESAFVPEVVDTAPTKLLTQAADPDAPPSGLIPDCRRQVRDTVGFVLVLVAMSLASVALGVALARFGVF